MIYLRRTMAPRPFDATGPTEPTRNTASSLARWRFVSLAILSSLFLGIASILGANGEPLAPMRAAATTAQDLQPRRAPAAETTLHVTGWAWKTRSGVPVIEGFVRNPSQRHYRYVQVIFTLYNKHGVQVGSALANVNHLEAAGTWKFQALALAEGVRTARLQEITGF